MAVRRLKSWIFCALLISLFHHDALAGIGAWKNYTDMKSVRAVASEGRTVWAATSGGVFRCDPADSAFQKFTNADGLSTNDVTSIFIDPSGRVWFGQFSGAIDVYDPKNDRWMYITDILLTTRTDKSIRGFFADGDRLYIATAFGIAVFSISRFEFIDTYANFATASQPIVNAVRVFKNAVVAATNRGMVVSKQGAVNLAAPESWDIYPAVTTGNSLVEFNNELYAGTHGGVLTFQNSAWSVSFGLSAPARLIAATDTALLFFESNSLRSVTAAGVVSGLSTAFADSSTGGSVTADNRVFLGFSHNGIGWFDGTANVWETYVPNGPFSNTFYQLAIDDAGVLWSVTGRSNGKGFYAFDGSVWKNFHTGNNGMVPSNDCFAVEIGPNNSKWISTWGGGLILVDNRNEIARVFNNTHPGFTGVSEGVSYVVPGKVSVDRSGNVWVNIFRSANQNKVLWKMKSDSTWESYPRAPFGKMNDWYMFDVVVDRNNTKWFTNAVREFSNEQTIVYYNESRNLSGSVNGWGTITEADGATSGLVPSMVVEKTGDIWIGTSTGVTIVTTPDNPANRLSKVFVGAVREQYIYCIAVDALNNKWVGTSRGVFVLSPDGTQLIDQYTVENTDGKLVDNNIFSIAFDKRRGIAYFGTEKGLSSLEIVSVAASPVISSIDLSPNPVYLPDQHLVEIRGLVDESTIKVLSVDGKVLRQFPAQGGGRAFWDCNDGEGNRVASGIYIIVAHDRTGTQVAAAKLAVIRK